jgi:hypothetical protein
MNEIFSHSVKTRESKAYCPATGCGANIIAVTEFFLLGMESRALAPHPFSPLRTSSILLPFSLNLFFYTISSRLIEQAIDPATESSEVGHYGFEFS